MRRMLMVTVLVLSAVLGNIALSGIEKTDAHTGYWRNTGNGLNLREGPGGQYAVIGSVPSQAVVRAYGHRGNWLKLRVLSSGQIGWAWLWNFHASSYLPPAPVSDPPSGGGIASGGGAICLTNYWSEYVCSSADTGNAIRYWAGQYGIGWWWLAATAACESSFHLYVVNPASGVSGLFQFEPGTFWAWGGGDLWDAWDQSRIAAKMFAAGEARQFYCAQLIGFA